MSKRKYKQGHTIKSFERLIYYLGKDGFIYARNKIYHKGWVGGWQFWHIKSMLMNGYIKRAIKIKEQS